MSQADTPRQNVNIERSGVNRWSPSDRFGAQFRPNKNDYVEPGSIILHSETILTHIRNICYLER